MSRKTALIWLRVLIVLSLAFIWGQSMLGREASAGESNAVRDFIYGIIGDDSAIDRFILTYIRKLAHFTEYGVLGVLVTLYRRALPPAVGENRAAKGSAAPGSTATGGTVTGSTAPGSTAADNASEDFAARSIARRRLGFSLLLGVCVAAIDETIQIFSHRGASVRDVCIDSAGYLTFTLLCTLVLRLAAGLRARSGKGK